MFDLGDEPIELDRAPYGANMAFARKCSKSTEDSVPISAPVRIAKFHGPTRIPNSAAD